MQSVVRRRFTHTGVMVRRNLIHLFRNGESMTMTFALPIMVTLVFVYVFGGALGEGGDRSVYLTYVLPGMIIMTPAFGAYMTSIGVCNDMLRGIIDRFRAMDIHQPSVLIGQIVSSVIRHLMGITILVLFGFLIGFRTEATMLEWVLVTVMIMMYVLMITMISVLVGLIGNSVESVGGMMMFVQFAPYISSAFVPTETMPKALGYFARYQPFTPITNAIRGLLVEGQAGNDFLVAMIWCAAITILCYVLSKRVYTKKTMG